jgi:glycolate oxidase FAD binding subunit
MSVTTLSHELADIVGKHYLLNKPADCAKYTVQGVTPALVVTPGSIDELAPVMAAAHAAGATVVPWGGGTQQSWGYPPARLDLVVRTARLNRVSTYKPDDVTIAVEAGITLAALDTILGRHGHMLPVDVPLPKSATLGGVLATAVDGPRRLGYGTLRDLLIGIQVVEVTGRVSKAGGLVVKNVSGYDMMKLYLGSLGSLAIIVSAGFKLIPRAQAAATIGCRFATSDSAFALIDALHTGQLTPMAVELLAQTGSTDQQGNSRLGHVAALFAEPACYGVLVPAEGLPAAVERHVRDVTRLAEQAGAEAVQTFADDAHADLWARVIDLPQTAEIAPGELVVRLTCLPGDLATALRDAGDIAAQHGLALLTVARALSGVAYFRLQANMADDRATAALQAWYQAMLRRRPHLTILAGAPTTKAGLSVWGGAPAGQAIMQRIKHAFDPEGRLNPGRFIV